MDERPHQSTVATRAKRSCGLRLRS
jgi:hypothetical protein